MLEGDSFFSSRLKYFVFLDTFPLMLNLTNLSIILIFFFFMQRYYVQA